MTTIDNTWYRPPTDPQIRRRKGAGGVVVRQDATGAIWVALVLGDHKGQGYILPKGGIDKGETALQAARREVAEEAGFTALTLLAELGTRERWSFPKTRWSITTYFLFSTTQIDAAGTDKKIQYTTHWHPLAALPDNILWPEQAKLITEHRDLIKTLLRPTD